jgi:hypothetical protein
MPTVAEIKAELKALGVRGITGKKKGELMAMIEANKNKAPPATATYSGATITLPAGMKKKKKVRPVVRALHPEPLVSVSPPPPVAQPPRGKFKQLVSDIDVGDVKQKQRDYYRNTTPEQRQMDILARAMSASEVLRGNIMRTL